MKNRIIVNENFLKGRIAYLRADLNDPETDEHDVEIINAIINEFKEILRQGESFEEALRDAYQSGMSDFNDVMYGTLSQEQMFQQYYQKLRQ